ncbi:MAG: putative bifunctional diguanylate cyclase/phosphodiesterase, partial [Wenzhouxiangellaceae bacterium]
MTVLVASTAAMVVCTGLLTLFMLDLMSASRAFLSGQQRWSSEVHLSIINLDRYAASGEHALLENARRHLDTPLTDRLGRIEAMRDQPDRQRVLEHFATGRQDMTEDLPVMTRYLRLMADTPPFRDAIEQWQETDFWILRLAALASELERLHAAEAGPDVDQIDSIRHELIVIDQSILDRTDQFVQHVSRGSRRITQLAMLVSILAIVLLTAALALLFHWVNRGIRHSEKRFWQMFERAPVGMALVDSGGKLKQVNNSLCGFLELRAEEILGKSLADFSDVRDRSGLRRFLDKLATEGAEISEIECRYLRPDNIPVWGKLSISRLPSNGNKEPSMIAVLENISEARSLSDELAYQAAHDQLTGLPNRREFERTLNHLLHQHDAGSGRHALGLIDLDQFKIVNDAFGHLAGDAVLVRLAENILQCLRAEDMLARLDGDEFGVLLHDCGIEMATQIANRLRDTISSFEFFWEDQPINVSASIGLVEINRGKHDAAWLMQRVDLACFEAKEQGRNQVRVHSDLVDTAPRRQEQMLWVHRVKDAISNDRLRFHGQLMMPNAGEQWRCELLVRLLDADGVLHTAGKFVESAERYHIARLLDEWVIRNSLDQIGRLHRSLSSISTWHINLSGQSVNCDSVLPNLIGMIRDSGIPTGKLCFEITESAAIHSLEEAQQFFSRIRDLGCEIALDDFGKGVSTFDYLKQLPVDVVKIDGSFVRELAHSELDHAMVRSIHEIARVAGLKTVAESVESMELILRLKQIGIDFMQGHVIHSP